MEQPTVQLSVGELKFRSLVTELMGKNQKEGVEIDCSSSSKARSVRRQFYTWRANLKPYERKFMDTFVFKVTGRFLSVQPSAAWTPVEAGVQNVSDSQGKSP